ncbi:MAG TPA: hypothetical protein VGW35_08320 [Methylomirabilota bacterium]|jgi:hypothetical protein|nr:hypothetical protein [Methylomirabilota bacterium]
MIDSRPRSRARALALLFLPLALAGCGTSGSSQSGTGGSFTFLTVDLFSLSGATPVSSVNSFLDDNATSTVVCVTLRNNLKNPGVTAPTTLDNVIIRTYTVSITRLDGGPPPGPFTFNTAFLVPAGVISGTPPAATGNTARVAIILVPAQAKNEPPLRPFPKLPLNATAEVIFKGENARGETLEARGAITLTFLVEAKDTAAAC